MLLEELIRRDFRYIFKPQYTVGACVADLYCHELRLAIIILEQDSACDYSDNRNPWLLGQDVTVLTFTPYQIETDINQVVDKIFHVCLHLSSCA